MSEVIIALSIYTLIFEINSFFETGTHGFAGKNLGILMHTTSSGFVVKSLCNWIFL